MRRIPTTKIRFAMKAVLFSILFASGVSVSFAQKSSALVDAQAPYTYLDSTMRFGAFGNLAVPYHIANFQTIPGCPICGTGFGSGSGMGADFGALFDYVVNPTVMIESRLGYHNLSGTLSNTEVTQVLTSDFSQQTTGTFTNTLTAHLATIGLSELVAYHPNQIAGMQLPGAIRLLAGPTISY